MRVQLAYPGATSQQLETHLRACFPRSQQAYPQQADPQQQYPQQGTPPGGQWPPPGGGQS